MAIRQTRELDRILQDAADRGDVSSVLLIPDEPVTFRVDGRIERTEGEALAPDQVRDIAVAALGEDRLAQLGAETGEALTSCALPGVVDGRLCVTRSGGHCSIVIRILPRGDLANLAERMGVPGALVDAALSPDGLVLVTGPARSGKTTTQYALLGAINDRRACHIATVEYVVGMRIPPLAALVQQREIGIDVPDCMGGIRAALSQGADVLMVGEIRSVEDLEACIRIGSLGRLVITQLHLPTPDAALARVIELVDDATRRQLARSLRAVSAQHLVPAASGAGHVAAFGLLVPDEAVRQAIEQGTDLCEPDTPPAGGCRSLRDDVNRLLQGGAITETGARDVFTAIG